MIAKINQVYSTRTGRKSQWANVSRLIPEDIEVITSALAEDPNTHSDEHARSLFYEFLHIKESFEAMNTDYDPAST